MENSLEKSKICRKISSLIKENKDYFIWLGAKFDEIEAVSVILPDYHGKDKYEFSGEIRIMRYIEDGGFISHHAIINGNVYLEEGKTVELADIEKHVIFQES